MENVDSALRLSKVLKIISLLADLFAFLLFTIIGIVTIYGDNADFGITIANILTLIYGGIFLAFSFAIALLSFIFYKKAEKKVSKVSYIITLILPFITYLALFLVFQILDRL